MKTILTHHISVVADHREVHLDVDEEVQVGVEVPEIRKMRWVLIIKFIWEDCLGRGLNVYVAVGQNQRGLS